MWSVPFKNKSGQDYGLDYYRNNKNAWVTAALVQTWLLKFNNFIGQEESDMVTLFIDYYFAHGTVETLSAL